MFGNNMTPEEEAEMDMDLREREIAAKEENKVRVGRENG